MGSIRLGIATILSAVALLSAMTMAPAQQVPRPGSPPAGPPGPSPGAPVPITPVPQLTAPGLPAPQVSASPATAPLPVVPGAATPAGTSLTAPPTRAAGALIRFTGQLLDLRDGYVFFTTSDAFRAAPAMRLVDYDTGGPTRLEPSPGIYGRATLDPQSGAIVELALTKRKLAQDEAAQQGYAQAHAFVVAGSPKVAAPELQGGRRLTGRPVAVTFFVQVPPNTPLTDSVYVTTDASGWVPNAMKMDRIDALHYRLTRTYASGTKFAYRYTRGTWTSVEVGEDGLQDDPHPFFVAEVDAKSTKDTVYRWSDENPNQPQVGPDNIPTPFNPNPFGNLPSAIKNPGVPQPSPTPRP